MPEHEQEDRERQQERAHDVTAAAQLQRVGVAEQPRTRRSPPGRQLPKIIAASPM